MTRPYVGRDQSRLVASALVVQIVHDARPIILHCAHGRQKVAERS